MALHADTGDGNTCSLHLLYHVVDAVALCGNGCIVVVIEKKGVGVGLVGKFKCLGNELVAVELVELALAVGVGFTTSESAAGIGHCFVYNIPCIYNILISVNHCVDVVTQASVEHFLGHGVAFSSFIIQSQNCACHTRQCPRSLIPFLRQKSAILSARSQFHTPSFGCNSPDFMSFSAVMLLNSF